MTQRRSIPACALLLTSLALGCDLSSSPPAGTSAAGNGGDAPLAGSGLSANATGTGQPGQPGSQSSGTNPYPVTDPVPPPTPSSSGAADPAPLPSAPSNPSTP